MTSRRSNNALPTPSLTQFVRSYEVMAPKARKNSNVNFLKFGVVFKRPNNSYVAAILTTTTS